MARYLRSTFDPSATAALPRIGRSTAANSGLAATVAGICIAYWLVAIGFVLCCINPTTWLLSTLTDASESSPYTSAQLTELAQQTRAYTVEGESADALYAAIGAQAKTLTDAQITAITGKSTALSGLDDAAAGRTLAASSERLSLTADAMTHLDQVHQVILGAFAVLLVTIAVGIPSIIYLLKRSRRSLARSLMGAGGAVLALFAVAGIWAASDFDTLFAFLHSLLFAPGTWTFSADSLLICMYPEQFWTAMGIVWGVVTVAASLVALSIGSRTKRNA